MPRIKTGRTARQSLSLDERVAPNGHSNAEGWERGRAVRRPRRSQMARARGHRAGQAVEVADVDAGRCAVGVAVLARRTRHSVPRRGARGPKPTRARLTTSNQKTKGSLNRLRPSPTPRPRNATPRPGLHRLTVFPGASSPSGRSQGGNAPARGERGSKSSRPRRFRPSTTTSSRSRSISSGSACPRTAGSGRCIPSSSG